MLSSPIVALLDLDVHALGLTAVRVEIQLARLGIETLEILGGRVALTHGREREIPFPSLDPDVDEVESSGERHIHVTFDRGPWAGLRLDLFVMQRFWQEWDLLRDPLKLFDIDGDAALEPTTVGLELLGDIA